MHRKKFLFSCILIILFFVQPLFAGPVSVAGYESSLTQEQMAAKILKMKKARQPGRFTRINKQVLKFEGYITGESYADYLKHIDRHVRVLVLNCLGGDTYSGVKIGMDIRRRGLKVVVDGLAVSSGANYLFLAGREKIIQNGVVGFHGNTQAFLKQSGGFENIRNKMKQEWHQGDWEREFTRFKKELQETVKLEKEFYASLGISQQLFDITQTDGKGMAPELKENFDFFLPSVAAMKQFGIKNVSGRQNIPLAEAVGMKVIYW